MTLHKNNARPLAAILTQAALAILLVSCTRTQRNIRQIPVVKVDDAVLTAGEFADRLADRLKLFDDLSAKDPNVLKRTKNLVVQEFIVQSVTQSWAKKHQLFVRKEDLDAEVNKIRKDYPDDIAFRKSLASEGLTFDTWEERLRMTLLQRFVQAALRKTISKPTASEAKSYFSNHRAEFQRPAALHVRQIVVANESDADQIKKALKAHRRFSDLAKKFSITPDGAKGGDLGWVEGRATNIFSAKGYPLKKLQLVKSPYGYHLFEVLERHSARPLTFDEARARIERKLLAEREQTVYSAWLERQILKSRIYKNDSLIKQVYVQSRSEN